MEPAQKDDAKLHKYSSCSSGSNSVSCPTPVPGFPVVVDSINDPSCPVPGLNRCVPEQLSNATAAIDDTHPKAHVYVAFAENTMVGNDDIIVRQANDEGLTWDGVPKVLVNTLGIARRFMPWIIRAGDAALVSWYDRPSCLRRS